MLQILCPGRVSKLLVVLALFISTSTAFGQSAAFTYQGRLTDGGAAANGTYDMQFKLYDTATPGTGIQIGSTITKSTVMVTSGVFTVDLDFGSSAFPGASRFLQIAVRANGSVNPYTELAPRQPVTSTPYALRTISAALADNATNATQLGGVTANQYVQTGDSRLTDARAPTVGSSNYIQNSTSTQVGSDFNISGSGTAGGTLAANVVNASTQYNLGGLRVLSAAGFQNFFAGLLAGQANTGVANSFFGFGAGAFNTSGMENSFFGALAGDNNTTGSFNSFFGSQAGLNTTSNGNSFFGRSAGAANTTGSVNAFFGFQAGRSNTTGDQNAFFGDSAGSSNTIASRNSFFGKSAGAANTTGIANAFFGFQAGGANTVGNNNAFFGFLAGSTSTSSNNSFFGASAGQQNTTGRFNAFFGDFAGSANTTANFNSFFGHSAGEQNTGNNNSFFGEGAGFHNTAGIDNTFVGTTAGSSNTTGNRNTFVGRASSGALSINNATAIGAFASVTQSDSLVLGSINGLNDATADVNVGIGTTAPIARLHINANSSSSENNTAIFSAPNLGPNSSHIHYGTTGDWYIRSAAAAGRVILQDSGGNVGVGTSTPNAKLQVTAGDAYVQTQGNGIILRATDGAKCFRVTVNNAGTLSTTLVLCP